MQEHACFPRDHASHHAMLYALHGSVRLRKCYASKNPDGVVGTWSGICIAPAQTIMGSYHSLKRAALSEGEQQNNHTCGQPQNLRSQNLLNAILGVATSTSKAFITSLAAVADINNTSNIPHRTSFVYHGGGESRVGACKAMSSMSGNAPQSVVVMHGMGSMYALPRCLTHLF